MTRSGNFSAIWSQDNMTVWRIKPVVTGITGETSPWYEYDSGKSARWLLSDKVVLNVHNMSSTTQKRAVSFVLGQNICHSVRRILISGLPAIDMTKRGTYPVVLQLSLLAGSQEKISIETISDKCVDPATGWQLRSSISPIQTEPTKDLFIFAT